MNTELAAETRKRGRRWSARGAHSRRIAHRLPPPRVALRTATPEEAAALNTLIAADVEAGHLLPRSIGELTVHAPRFVVAVEARGGVNRDDRILGCAELAPLSSKVAEVRSLVVDARARRAGIGRRLVEELQGRALLEGYETLCAFTHDPGYFVRKGFSIVPHTWVPEKIALDCHGCPLFRRCGQYAVVRPLASVRHSQPSHAIPPAVDRGQEAPRSIRD